MSDLSKAREQDARKKDDRIAALHAQLAAERERVARLERELAERAQIDARRDNAD